jgi:hypothetical protein
MLEGELARPLQMYRDSTTSGRAGAFARTGGWGSGERHPSPAATSQGSGGQDIEE